VAKQSTKNKSEIEFESSNVAPKAEPLTISLGEAADLLGIHRSTAWNLQSRGNFPVPVLRIGSSLRVKKANLMKFIETGVPIAPGDSERAAS
jgi:excisionase family DNA binding protein